jgi:hypothetical protein
MPREAHFSEHTLSKGDVGMNKKNGFRFWMDDVSREVTATIILAEV